MSFAYEVSASMSCTASPGMRRGRVNTIAVAISSEGTATSNRRARYRLSTPASSPRGSAIQPCRREAAAEIVAEVRAVVLQRALPHRDAEPRMNRDVVLLRGEMALHGVDQLTTLRRVERAALTQDQVRRDGVLDVALVARFAGLVLREIPVGLEKVRLGPERKGIELSDEARRKVGAVLLLVEPRVDAGFLQLGQNQLGLVHEDRRTVCGEAYVGGHAIRMTRR